ncbi:hypothetical protein HMPREF3201_01634 [Megasphaera sp. MJR8396C]|nr:hypothetical protein HMPREF3201_01634 [Megasphaera sp. MJR8396C]
MKFNYFIRNIKFSVNEMSIYIGNHNNRVNCIDEPPIYFIV